MLLLHCSPLENTLHVTLETDQQLAAFYKQLKTKKCVGGIAAPPYRTYASKQVEGTLLALLGLVAGRRDNHCRGSRSLSPSTHPLYEPTSLAAQASGRLIESINELYAGTRKRHSSAQSYQTVP